MCRGTLAVLVLVSYCIAVGTTFSIPEYGNDVYSIPPVERNDTCHVIGRSSSMNINFHDFVLVDYILSPIPGISLLDFIMIFFR